MESIWSKTCDMKKRQALDREIETEVAVIGGGMAGILTAYQLERSGVRTVVLEAERAGGGQTKNTTAKITSQHGMFCRDFIEKKGKDAARQYVRANQAAVEEYNLNSPKQLGHILFEKLGLPPIKKTKTGYSTSVEVLEQLKMKSPIVSEILDYRQIAKIQNTYVKGLLECIQPENNHKRKYTHLLLKEQKIF